MPPYFHRDYIELFPLRTAVKKNFLHDRKNYRLYGDSCREYQPLWLRQPRQILFQEAQGRRIPLE